MNLKEVEEDLPILLTYYDQVVKILEAKPVRTRRIVPRKEALDLFLKTKSFRETAKHFDVSPSAINDIVYRAYRAARKLAGVKPLGAFDDH